MNTMFVSVYLNDRKIGNIKHHHGVEGVSLSASTGEYIIYTLIGMDTNQQIPTYSYIYYKATKVDKITIKKYYKRK